MKLSVNYWMLGGFDGTVPVADAAAKAKQLGFDAIELCFGIGELAPTVTDEDLSRLREALDAATLPVASLCTGHYWDCSLSSPEEQERSEAIAFTKAYIRAARALGTDAILVVPGAVDVGWDPSRPVVPVKQVHALATQSLQALIPTAEENGVVLCVENVWNKFLTGPFEYADFLDALESPWVKAYFDVGNCMISGYPEHWIEVLGERIRRVHIKGFRRREGGGTLSDFTESLLESDVNWAAVMKALEAAGYDGYLTAEMLVSDQGLPDAAMSGRVREEMTRIVRGEVGSSAPSASPPAKPFLA